MAEIKKNCHFGVGMCECVCTIYYIFQTKNRKM